MSQGLYSKADLARYFGCKHQEVARMIREDGLPAITLPGEKRPVVKVTLHGLHGWLKERHSGGAFMTPDQLAAEIAAANVETADTVCLGLLQLRAATAAVFESIRAEMGRKAAA